MEIRINNIHRGQHSSLVAFMVSGVPHTAVVTADEITVYAFGRRGDACTTTHAIDAPEIVDALDSVLASEGL